MKQSKKQAGAGVGVIAVIPTRDADPLVLTSGNLGRGDLVIRFCSGELLKHFNPGLETFMKGLNSGEFSNYYWSGVEAGLADSGVMMGYTPFPLESPEAFGDVFKMAHVDPTPKRSAALLESDCSSVPQEIIEIDDSIAYFKVKALGFSPK